MTVLFLDTETTGFDASACVVELAFQLDDDTTPPTMLAEKSYLIQPPLNVAIAWPATCIHGIATSVAQEHGIPFTYALLRLRDALRNHPLVVAHGIAFDIRILNQSAAVTGEMISWPHSLCTMHSLTRHCRLRNKNGGDKPPTLAEAHQWMFGTVPPSLHRARHDMLACRSIYYEGKRRRLW